MSAPAVIRQADMERMMKAARNAGWPSMRISIDRSADRIDIMLGGEVEPQPAVSEWDEDDGEEALAAHARL